MTGASQYMKSKTASLIAILIVAFGMQLLAIKNSSSANAAPSTTELTLPAGLRGINDISVSADGTKLVIVSGSSTANPFVNKIHTSSDSGASWTDTTPTALLQTTSAHVPTWVASSKTGQKVVVGSYTSTILQISNDYGATWTTKDLTSLKSSCGNQGNFLNHNNPSNPQSTGFAISPDGTTIAMGIFLSTCMLVSTDSGVTFSKITLPTYLDKQGAIQISQSANAIWFAKSNTAGSPAEGGLWKLNTTNWTWSSNFSATVGLPRGLTASEDGTILYTAGGGGYNATAALNFAGVVYKSTDSGATFSAIAGTSKNWLGIRSSSDGTKLIGWDTSSNVWISEDSGANWTLQHNPGQFINSVDFSADGSAAYMTMGYYNSPTPTSRVYRYSFPAPSTTTLTTQYASAVYGASNTLTATISSNTATGTVNFKNGASSISGCSAQTVTAGVATCTTWKPSVGTYSNITAIYSGDSNLGGSTSGSISISVTQAPLTVTSSSPSVVYGTTAPTVTASYSGLVNGDASSVVTGISCTSAYTTSSAVGSLPTTSCSGGSANDYSISYVTGAVTVNKATPTFNSWSNVSKVYGASPFDLTTPTSSTPGTWGYSSATASVVSLNGSAATVVGYGTSVITATFTPTDTTNFISDGTTTMTVTVGKPTLSITASSHTVAYGGAIPTITPTISGFVNGEDSSVITGLSCSTTYTTATAVGTTGSSCTGATATNYSFSYTAGVVTVTQGAQTNALAIDSTSVTFGSSLSLTTTGGSGSGANIFAVDSGPCAISGATLTATAAGTCMVTATKEAAGNYLAASSASTAITINPKGLTVSGLTGVNKEFDGTRAGSATGTPTLVGVVGSDDVLPGGTPAFTFASANVANGITVVASGYTLTGTTAGNYTLTQPTLTANITAKAARVAANNVTVAFGATITSGVTATGLISPDAVGSASYTYTGTGTSTPPTAVGVYTVTPSSAVFSTGLSGNYLIAYDTATVTILAKYTTTYNANGGVVSGGSTSNVDYVVGDNALTLPTPTRANYTFTGWHTLQTNGLKITGSYIPTATATLWAHWVQNSLYGIGASTKILTITTLAGVGNTYSANAAGGTIGIEYLADALPAGTIIDAYVLSDTSTATALIGASNNYVMSLVLAWVALDGTVPTTATGKAISMTITNSAIKKGAKIYSVIGENTTLLGVATVDGSAVISITDDPQIIIAITKPDVVTGVSATSGGNTVSTVSWTAPANDGGSAITSYTAVSSAGQSCTTATTSCQVTGLTNGTSYTFTVTALNAIGVSDTSTASVAITPSAPAPVQVSVVTPAPTIVVTQAVVSTSVPVVMPTITSLTFVENAAKTGGKLVWAGTNIESVLFTGTASTYPAPFNYGAFTLTWDGTLVEMTPGVTYTMKLEVRSSTGGSASRTLEYAIAKPVIDITAVDAALKIVKEKAEAEKKAAAEAAVAALKIAQDKASAEAKATEEAAALKAAQEKAVAEAKAAAEAAAIKAAQEKATSEAKAAEDAAALKIAQDKAAAEAKALAEAAAALKIGQDKAAADAAALVLAKKTPILNLFTWYASGVYTASQTSKMKKLTLKLEPDTTLKCIGYINNKGTTAAKAKAIALAQAKTTCASAKKLNPSITTVVTTAALIKAPKSLAGASNSKAKYRVDLFAYRG